MRNDDRRVTELVVASEIRNLKLEYAQLCDDGYDGQKLGRLFTEDAIWDGGTAFGRYDGRTEIASFFSGLSGGIVWALHYMIGPRVTHVAGDGERAEASWYLWMPHITSNGGGRQDMLLTAKQYDRYRAVGDEWKFEEIRVEVESMGPADQGWEPYALAADSHAGAERGGR